MGFFFFFFFFIVVVVVVVLVVFSFARVTLVEQVSGQFCGLPAEYLQVHTACQLVFQGCWRQPGLFPQLLLIPAVPGDALYVSRSVLLLCEGTELTVM